MPPREALHSTEREPSRERAFAVRGRPLRRPRFPGRRKVCRPKKKILMCCSLRILKAWMPKSETLREENENSTGFSSRALAPPAATMNKKQIQLKKKEKERKEAAGVKSATSKESLAKQAKDAAAHICQSCRQTFMVTAKSKHLVEHCDAKHAKLPREQCFPELPEMIANEAMGGGKKK